MANSAYHWVNSCTSEALPPMAIQVGVDEEGHALFTGRTHFQGELVPVHIVPARRAAYVAHYGKEHFVDSYQVLCMNRIRWVPCQGGNVPSGAVQTGHNKDGAPLYVGRAFHGGANVIGKIHPKFGCCFIPYEGKEIQVKQYEALVYQ